jgi:hypothetical protein
MSQCAGELIEPFGLLDQAAIDVDKPTGQRERIDFARIHDVEVPGEVGATRLAGDVLPELSHVFRDARVIQEW